MPDQVTIKFGPAKLNTPKAIRNSIADTAVQTQADTIAEVTNNTSINVGGSVTGTVAQVATIDTFDPYTNTGTATFNLDAISLNYTNATGSYLNPGDEVVILEDTNTDYTAVAVYQRMPSVPGSIPAAGIAPGFPIDVTNAANKMGRVVVTGENTSAIKCIYDEQGVFSGYSDTILNRRDNIFGGNGDLNGYSRSISQSIATGVAFNTANSSFYIQTNGTLWEHQQGSFLRYKLTTSSSYVTVDSSINSFLYFVTGFACDPTTGWVWISGNDNTGLDKIFYVNPNIPFAITEFYVFPSTGYGVAGLFADAGFLYIVGFNNSPTSYFINTKPSSNLNAMTLLCNTSYSVISAFQTLQFYGKMAGSYNNELLIIRDNTTTGFTSGTTMFIDRYGIGGLSSFDTGLPYNSGSSIYESKVDGISVSPSGFLVIAFATDASYFGLGTGTEWLPGVMITNFSSIAYPFVDPAMMTTILASGYYQSRKVGSTNIVKRSDGSMIWVVSTANLTNNGYDLYNSNVTHKTRIYEITGL